MANGRLTGRRLWVSRGDAYDFVSMMMVLQRFRRSHPVVEDWLQRRLELSQHIDDASDRDVEWLLRVRRRVVTFLLHRYGDTEAPVEDEVDASRTTRSSRSFDTAEPGRGGARLVSVDESKRREQVRTRIRETLHHIEPAASDARDISLVAGDRAVRETRQYLQARRHREDRGFLFVIACGMVTVTIVTMFAFVGTALSRSQFLIPILSMACMGLGAVGLALGVRFGDRGRRESRAAGEEAAGADSNDSAPADSERS